MISHFSSLINKGSHSYTFRPRILHIISY